MATGPSNNPPPAAAAPDDAAQKEQEKREAVQKLRERQQQNNAAEHYKDTHFWAYWNKLSSQPNQADPLTGALSSAPGEQTLLEPGTYEKRGVRRLPGNHPILAQFDYDKDKKVFTVTIDIRRFTGGAGITGNHVKWEPIPGREAQFDFKAHAHIMGREQVRFLGGKPNCFSSVTLTFKDDHPFSIGLGGNVGSNTLAYTEAQVAAALEEAMNQGVGFNVSSNFLQAVFDKRGPVARTKLDAEITKANENGKMHQYVNGFAGAESLQVHQKALQGVGDLSATDIAKFSQGMDSDIDAQDKKIKALEKDIAALGAPAAGTPDATKLSQLQAQLVVEKDRLIELNAEKARLDGLLPKVKDGEDLQQLKDQWEAAKNPQQPLKDAIDELKGAIAGVADMDAYKDPSDPTGKKNRLQELKDHVAKLESLLAKDMNKAERGKVEKALQAMFTELKKLSYPNDNEKNKIVDAVNKAEKLVAGDKLKAAAAQRIDGRVDKLEKAVAELNKAYKEYKDFDPQKLMGPPGMIVGRKAFHLPGQSRFNRIQTPEQAQKYIDQRFNALEQNRKDLQGLIDAEKKKLDGAAKNLPPVEQKKIEDRLNEIQKQMDAVKQLQADIQKKAAAAPAAPKGP